MINKTKNIKIKMNNQKNMSFAELKSMETPNINRVPLSTTPDFGNSQERPANAIEEKLTLKTNAPLDFDLLSQEPVNKSSEQLRGQSKGNKSVESRKFKSIKQKQSKEQSLQNSVKSGSRRSGKKSMDKKSKSLVYPNKFKKPNLKIKMTNRVERQERKSRTRNQNSKIVQNIRRRKERQSIIQNRSTSKKKRSRNMFEFKKNHRTINHDQDSQDSPTRKNYQFYQSQQNHQMGFPDNRFQSNPRAPKSRFSKRGSQTNQEFENLKKQRNKNPSGIKYESKRYVNFQNNKQEIYDSNVLSNGHQSASQSIPKLLVNGHSAKNPGESELNRIETQNSVGGWQGGGC